MPMQQPAQLKYDIRWTLRDWLAVTRAMLLLTALATIFISLYWLRKSKVDSVSDQPERRGIARVESVLVSGKFPTQTIYLRFKGDVYSVTYRTLHDVAPGMDAEIKYRTAPSGEVVIYDVQRIRPRQRN